MQVMTKAARPRGLIGAPRADASGLTVDQVFAEMKRTLVEFRSEVDKEIEAQIKKGTDDVVRTEKIDRMNAAISEMQNAIADLNRVQAAITLGGGASSDGVTAEQREHAKAFGRYFRRGVTDGLGEAEAKAFQVNAMTATDSDPDGGYLVPTEVESGIDQILRDTSVMRQLASVRTIGTDEYRKLINMGGASSGWVGEQEIGSDRAETATPTLRELIFHVQEMYSMPATTQKMLDDGIIDVAAWLADEVNIEFAEQESQAFIDGDGSRKPMGLWSYPKKAKASWSVTSDWGKFPFIKTGVNGGFIAPTATASPADFFIDMIYALKPVARSRGSFLMNDTTAQVVRKMKWHNTGEYIWREPDSPEDVPRVFGKPVYTDDYVPALGTGNYPIAFGDFARSYGIFDRQGIRTLRDSITQKGKVLFYTTKRVGAGALHFQYLVFGQSSS